MPGLGAGSFDGQDGLPFFRTFSDEFVVAN